MEVNQIVEALHVWLGDTQSNFEKTLRELKQSIEKVLKKVTEHEGRASSPWYLGIPFPLPPTFCATTPSFHDPIPTILSQPTYLPEPYTTYQNLTLLTRTIPSPILPTPNLISMDDYSGPDWTVRKELIDTCDIQSSTIFLMSNSNLK